MSLMNGETLGNKRVGRPGGFTLIELIVAMVIAAVLIAIAVPSYINYSVRAHRTDAKSALLDLASLEERYYTTTNSYASAASAVGYGTAAWPITIGSGYYQLQQPVVGAPTAPTATTTGSPATYTLTAVPIGTQATRDLACASFVVKQDGSRTATASGGGDNTATCWN